MKNNISKKAGEFSFVDGHKNNESKIERLAELYQKLILLIGEDPNREGLKDTATRAAKSLLFLTSGYNTLPKDEVNDALFTCHSDEMIIVKDIELFSICEHHLLPFIGKCHIGYIPNGKIVGLSKIARVVDVYARRLQIQEHLTKQIADAIAEILMAKGVIVIIEAMHLCMMMRGVQKSSVITKTLATTGVFKNNSQFKQEFLQTIVPDS